MARCGSTKVLIVDDSALIRSMLTRVLSSEEGIKVVGGAKDPYDAREMIIRFNPDVIILDIQMPRMDGITFLRKLMTHYPVPVIMCSGNAPANSKAAIESIEIGAVDVVAKPRGGGTEMLLRLGAELADKIRAAALSVRRETPLIPQRKSTDILSLASVGVDPNSCLVVLGASTGGTEATKELLSNVPADFPPVAIVQHMPEGFTKSYAGRLNEFSPMTVREAEDGDILTPGNAFVARGGIQMTVRKEGTFLKLRYGTDELVNRHCPSVDVLFDSAVRIRGKHLVGILLTGMGADGAKGLLSLRETGAVTIAQDPDSCVVYGMPKVAVELGAAMKSAPPQQIPNLAVRMLKRAISGKARMSV